MLRELAKLSGGMLFLGGHVTDLETVRLLARDEASSMRTPRGGKRLRHAAPQDRDWRTPLEPLMLATISGSSFLVLCSAVISMAST